MDDNDPDKTMAYLRYALQKYVDRTRLDANRTDVQKFLLQKSPPVINLVKQPKGKGAGRGEAVSYTHLTLPTILRV